MGVYIKDINMPSCCHECICMTCEAYKKYVRGGGWTPILDRRLEDCPLTEVPEPHGRLIDADALSKKLCETTIFIKDGEVFQRMINDAPTVPVVDITQRDLCADISCTDCPFMQETCKLMDYVAYADRPHGEWVEREDWNGDSYYNCSVCGESFVLCDGTPSMNLYHYCPNCGADMRGDEENE